MSWKYVEKPKTVLASKSLVDEFVAMDKVPRERPLSERRLMVYERILKAGKFRPVTWASALCEETGGTYRVNGQHTSLLLWKQNPIPEFYVTVERYRCKTMHEVADLYNTFDSKMATRTVSDINMSFAATIKELEGVSSPLISQAVTAIAFSKWGAAAKEIPAAERAEELMDHFGFAVWLGKMFRGKRMAHAHLIRSPVISAMFQTWVKVPRKAEEFWVLVKDETSPNVEDPSRVLAKYLIRTVMAASRVGNRGLPRKIAPFREIFVKCIHAWNAWRAAEKTALNYHPTAPIPAVK